MAKPAFMRTLGSGLIAVLAGGLLASCYIENVKGAGNIQAQVWLPGHVDGSVAYTAQMSSPSGPAIAAAYTCVNSVGKGCADASIGHGSSLMTPLVDGANNTTVTSYLVLSQLQPGAWTLDFTINGTQQQDIKLCGVPVAAGKKTAVTILAGGLRPSASYQVGDGGVQKAAICQ